MSWNYRVIKRTGVTKLGDTDFPWTEHAIHEVYYTKKGQITNWSENPMDPHGETLEELKQSIRWMLEACEKPILIEKGNKLEEIENV